MQANDGGNSQKDENLLKALEMGIFTPSTKQRLEELEGQKEKINCEMLVQTIHSASPVSGENIYAFFLSFKNLDYTQPRNREQLIEIFVRKVVLFDDKDEPIIYYNGFNDNAEIKENAETETEFGFDALGGEGGIRTHVRLPSN